MTWNCQQHLRIELPRTFVTTAITAAAMAQKQVPTSNQTRRDKSIHFGASSDDLKSHG